MNLATCCTELSGMIGELDTHVKAGNFSGMLAFSNNTCVGAIIATLDVDASIEENPFPLPSLRILFVEVNKRFRGRGIASYLLKEFLRVQQAAGIEAVFVSLFKQHNDGAAFFERLGFERERTDRNKILLKLHLWSDFGVVDIDDEDIA